MKVKVSMLALFACSLFFFGSCDDDDDVEDVVEQSFKLKYPNAQKVEWKDKHGFQIVDFVYESKEMEAWFEKDGRWVMARTTMSYTDLPQGIQDSFKSGKYNSWEIDDAEKLERLPTEILYILEVKQGSNEYGLYYSEDGTMIKDVKDFDDDIRPLSAPDGVYSEIKSVFPNAKILDIDKTGENHLVYIKDGNLYKRILLDSNHKWMSTEWYVSTSDVPKVVMDALKASEYGNYTIENVSSLERGQEHFYVFNLISGDRTERMTINQNGTIVER